MRTLHFMRNGDSRASLANGFLPPMITLATLLGCAVGPENADAKDLRALTEIVIPHYTAMNFAVICAQDHPQFLSQTRGPRGNALEYAQHVKDEAIAALTDDEAAIVLKTAADEARSAARRTLRSIFPNYPAYRPSEITSWCANEASSFVRDVIEQHDRDHAVLLQEIDRAKR